MQLTVTIVIASFNKEKYISETVGSVINQTYQYWELIIVDDGSNDGTCEIINDFVNKDTRIKLYRNSENKGANYSRNYALTVAVGDFIIFLDADDILVNTCIENRVKKMEITKADLCIFTMGVFKKVIGDSNYLWIPKSKNALADFLKHKLPWSILQPIWKKVTLVKLGGFDESFERLQDVELHTRALLQKEIAIVQFVAAPDCYYRIDEARKNFDAYQFLKRRIASTLLYCQKFSVLIQPMRLKYLLVGTLFQTYLQILIQLKQNHITKTEFQGLSSQLLAYPLSKWQLFLFNLAKWGFMLPFKIPGINWLINRTLLVG